MGLPNYTKITKNGVEYLDGTDRCCYTIKELSRAALRDVGKFICKIARPKLSPIYGSVADNVNEIRRIEGQYLSAIEEENRALGLISEEEYADDE